MKAEGAQLQSESHGPTRLELSCTLLGYKLTPLQLGLTYCLSFWCALRLDIYETKICYVLHPCGEGPPGKIDKHSIIASKVSND